jgi:hypothetical protein
MQTGKMGNNIGNGFEKISLKGAAKRNMIYHHHSSYIYKISIRLLKVTT